jgi:NAD(P)-dependent dehydrogenase (short-subunit alcohol dehydrogenase family)
MNTQNISQLFSLQNKTAIVTGGTGVLGSAMARGLAAAGARVVIIGRRKNAAEELASELNKSGYQALGLSADVLKRVELEAAKQQTLEKFGSIDILVNGAGGNMPGATIPPDKNFLDLNLEDFQQVVDLNLLGTVLPTQVFCEAMVKQKKGVIINIASMSSFRPITRIVGYAAAKSAVHSFTEWMAIEMAHKFGEGIRVNAIAPGFFLTEQNRTLLTNPDGSYTARGQSVIANTPFGRFGKPEELVGTLIWLCSDAAAFVTGVDIPVDGGFNVYCGV